MINKEGEQMPDQSMTLLIKKNIKKFHVFRIFCLFLIDTKFMQDFIKPGIL